MPLIELWEKTPDIVLQYNIKQIVSAAGDGVLADKSDCSEELRFYLRNIPTEKLFEHVNYCLLNSFDKSGLVLQDIINELGRRLDYEVEDGLYKGKRNQIGYDGIWRAPDGHSIIIEIKTSDAYRINLDTTIGNYRKQLIKNEQITDNSSMLIVVGRNDTGDLEAQIRGSRHAWDTRIISTDALVKLVELKVKSDEDETIEKIRSLLIPFEYTRLDNIIDVMFTTAKDVESSADEPDHMEEDQVAASGKGHKQEHTPRELLESARKKAVEALSKKVGVGLIAHKRVQFWSSDKQVRAVVPVSKNYGKEDYWYAFHPRQNKFLEDAEKGFVVLGCVDKPQAFAIQYEVFSGLLPHLGTTNDGEGEVSHWHLIIIQDGKGDYQLQVPKQEENLGLNPYILRTEADSVDLKLVANA